jgi:hypothetical protein
MAMTHALLLISEAPLSTDELQFEVVREQAARAAELLAKLFGDGNLPMLSRPWPEQSQRMANVLDLIDQDQLEAKLLEVTGDELLPIIRRVSHRGGQLRHGPLMKPGKPETIPMVEAALEPMITMRPATTTGASAEAPGPVGDPHPSDDRFFLAPRRARPRDELVHLGRAVSRAPYQRFRLGDGAGPPQMNPLIY